MKLIGNIIWFSLGGLWLGLGWALLGLLLCITILGIPFGKQVEVHFDKHPVANLLWAIFFGWEMALGYLVSGVLCCITIVGIPLGLQAFKLMKLAFLPFGARVTSGK